MRAFVLTVCLWIALPVMAADTGASSRGGVRTQDFALQVVDDSGAVVDMPQKNGWSTLFPQAQSTYTLRLTNNTTERLDLLVAVDDINPLTGKKAYRAETGYVVDPGKTIDIKKFHSKKGDLPIRLDPERRTGTITVLAYRERMDYPFPMPWTEEYAKKVGGQVRPAPRKGDLLWLPPSGAAFRRLSATPSSSVHIEYGKNLSITYTDSAVSLR